MSPPMLPLFELSFTAEDRAAADAVLASGWMTSGPKVAEFEAAFGAALGVDGECVVAVSSCTSALQLALALHGIGPGDEVIVPAVTFVAASNAVRVLGATPVFADCVALDDPNVDAASVARLISPRTKAVIPVHYAAYPCDLDALEKLGTAHNLQLVEDAAHACITPTNAGKCGTRGDYGAFSFFSNKNLAIGEGGALVCRRREDAELAKRLRSHGMTTMTVDRHKGYAMSYDVTHPGYNFRWDEWRAAVAISKLARLDAELARRRELNRIYRGLLAEKLPAVTVPFSGREEVAAHIFPVVLPAATDRAKLMARMREAGVQTSIHYPLTPAFSQFEAQPARGEWAVAENFCARTLTLPFFPAMTNADVARVVDALANGLAGG